MYCSTFIKLKISKAGWDICGLDKEACKRGPHETALTLPLDLPHKQWLTQDRTTCSGGGFLIFFFFYHLTVLMAHMQGQHEALTLFWWFLQRTPCTNLQEEGIFRLCDVFWKVFIFLLHLPLLPYFDTKSH